MPKGKRRPPRFSPCQQPGLEFRQHGDVAGLAVLDSEAQVGLIADFDVVVIEVEVVPLHEGDLALAASRHQREVEDEGVLLIDLLDVGEDAVELLRGVDFHAFALRLLHSKAIFEHLAVGPGVLKEAFDSAIAIPNGVRGVVVLPQPVEGVEYVLALDFLRIGLGAHVEEGVQRGRVSADPVAAKALLPLPLKEVFPQCGEGFGGALRQDDFNRGASGPLLQLAAFGELFEVALGFGSISAEVAIAKLPILAIAKLEVTLGIRLLPAVDADDAGREAAIAYSLYGETRPLAGLRLRVPKQIGFDIHCGCFSMA